MAIKKIKKEDQRLYSVNLRFSKKELKQLNEFMKQRNAKVKSKFIRDYLMSIVKPLSNDN